MNTLKYIDVDHVQFCLAVGIVPLPIVHLAFLNALLDKERKNQLCLVPFSRFEVFHLNLKPNNPQRPAGERRRVSR